MPNELAKESVIVAQREAFQRRHPDAVFKPQFGYAHGKTFCCMDNSYQKLRGEQIRYVWNQLNYRLLKWVKWEKGLYKMRVIRWFKSR